MSLLKRLFKGNSSSGLNDDQILELEQKLNKKIPKSYRDFLQNYPNELIKLGYPYNTVSELSLPNTVERIVEINEFEEVDKNILVIGVNGLGDFYYIILDGDTKKIHEFQHDSPPTDKGKVIWNTQWPYQSLKDLIKELKETLS